MPFRFCFPPDQAHLRTLRKAVRQSLDEQGIGLDVVDSVILVLDELICNAIEHAGEYREATGELVVMLELEGDDVMLDFRDPDMPQKTVRWLADTIRSCRAQRPPPDLERGRGLYLVATTPEELSIHTHRLGGLHLRGRFRGDPA